MARTNLEKIDGQLTAWGARIDALVRRAEVGDGTATTRVRIDELRAKHAMARARLDEARGADTVTWSRLRDGLAIAWMDLVLAFRALERQAEH